jgi:aminoacylase
MATTNEDPAVTRFREYLRLPSVHPNPDYSGCIEWLRQQAKEIGLEFNIVEFPKPAEFTVWLTWKGKDSNLKSVILNSHIDVVPVERNKWTRDPFGAEKDAEGNIYARGSQDMKCVGVQYLEAIRRFKAKGMVPLRDVHVTFVPDEEVGGYKGMKVFVDTPEFKKLNAGFALDEGIASPDESFHLFYGERAIWQLKFTATGKTGHASILFDDTAAEKIHYIMNKLLSIRKEQKAILEKTGCDLGSVTSVNMTMLSGGLQANVVPPELSAVFDLRISPAWKLEDVRKLLDDLCVEAGPGVKFEFLQFSNITACTSPTSDNAWWTTFKETSDKLGLKLNQRIFPAATDCRYVRNAGIPAFGFSPMNNTPVLLHDHDEFLNENIFLRGIQIYEALLDKVINLPGNLSP